MQRFLSISDMVVRNKYPKSSKVYLSQMGLPIGICTRESCPELTEEELLVNKCLMEAGNEIREMFE
jgi:dihydrodipicolinate synthase/N-acetylneuraminate lyase